MAEASAAGGVSMGEPKDPVVTHGDWIAAIDCPGRVWANVRHKFEEVTCETCRTLLVEALLRVDAIP